MKLDAWLVQNPRKAEGFHIRIGVSRFSLDRYRTGERKPNAATMPLIARETDYQVTANDFYGIDIVRAAKAALKTSSALKAA